MSQAGQVQKGQDWWCPRVPYPIPPGICRHTDLLAHWHIDIAGTGLR